MGIPEKVALLIETEVEKRVHEELCKVVEKVSKLYHVPLKIARKDLIGNEFCLGVKKDGTLCKNRAVLEGYCMHHVNDKRPIQLVGGSTNTNKRHNHPYPSPPQPNCPACNVAHSKVNEFRELSTIM